MDSILDNYHYMPTSLTDSTGLPIMRCVPKMETNVIMVYGMGNTTKVIYRPTCIAPGVDTHYVHNYNVASGWALPDERTQDERQAESIRTSVSRSIRAVRELAACNPWQFFVTITLSPQLWKNRYTPDGLQDIIKAMAKRWRRKRKNGSAHCPGFAYLLVPEMHKDGAIHLHGFVSCMPSSDCIPYTMSDVNGSKKLPIKICEKVRKGSPVFHCREWERLFGYNTLEPVIDLDKASSYVVKYISKEITRLGRAAHVHLICICQRSDVGSIPGALKANMEIRITSHCADKESSMTILGTGDAANLPKIPGRFLSSDGTEFQAYNFSCPPGKNL